MCSVCVGATGDRVCGCVSSAKDMWAEGAEGRKGRAEGAGGGGGGGGNKKTAQKLKFNTEY